MVAVIAAVLAPAGAMAADTTELVGHGGAAAGGGYAGMSSDGSKVLLSTIHRLVPADTDSVSDIYERSGGTFKLLTPDTSVAVTGSLNTSPDGSRMYLQTTVPMLPGDTDGVEDVYLLSGGAISLVSEGAVQGAFLGTATPDGAHVFFTTTSQLSEADTDTTLDIYRRSGDTMTLISQGSADVVGINAVSSDGKKVVFSTKESLAGTDTDGGFQDVYENDEGVIRHVSAGGNAGSDATFGGLSADGSRILFTADLDVSDPSSGLDVYERSGGVTTLLSEGASTDAHFARMSLDGTRVIFTTLSSLTAADADGGFRDVYERAGGITTLLSPGPTSGGSGDVVVSAASADGKRVLMRSYQRMTAADTDSSIDVYERFAGATTLISTAPGTGNSALDVTFSGASADGSTVVFATNEKMLASDTDTTADLYVRAGEVTKHVSTGPTALNSSLVPTFRSISTDGRRIAFTTAEALVVEDTNSFSDVYIRHLGPICTITGTAGNDNLVGTKGDDVVCGLGGNDTLTGLGGNDVLEGGDGNDTLLGGAGADTLDGGAGTDVAGFYDSGISGVTVDLAAAAGTGSGGGAGSDSLFSVENVDGSPGDDTITGSTAANWMDGRGGNDAVFGGDGNDTLIGSAGNDTLRGQSGNDGLQPGAGSDDADGGTGGETYFGDIIRYTDAAAAVTVDLATNTVGGAAAGDTIAGFESAYGSAFDDVLSAGLDGVRSLLTGNNGDDELSTEDADDTDSIMGGNHLVGDTCVGSAGDMLVTCNP
jgi:Ca2+-binding RTX toxin-like protein